MTARVTVLKGSEHLIAKGSLLTSRESEFEFNKESDLYQKSIATLLQLEAASYFVSLR